MEKEDGLKHCSLYTYILSNQPKSTRVRFVYLLKGRGEEKGIVEKLKGKFLAPGCFMIPEDNEKEMQEIFSLWKIKFKKMTILIR